MSKITRDELNDNLIFVGTIYDSFEALEETLGKLKLEKPLFITHIAKMAFAEEVFKRADGGVNNCRFVPPQAQRKHQQHSNRFYN